jgi:hypothetical protein
MDFAFFKKPKTKGKKQYKASIGGLLTGKSIIEAPKIKLTGVGIRYPIKAKKGKKKIIEEDIFSNQKWLSLGV